MGPLWVVRLLGWAVAVRVRMGAGHKCCLHGLTRTHLHPVVCTTRCWWRMRTPWHCWTQTSGSTWPTNRAPVQHTRLTTAQTVQWPIAHEVLQTTSTHTRIHTHTRTHTRAACTALWTTLGAHWLMMRP